MATNLIQFQPHSIIRASAAASDHRKPDSNRPNWWTPLFGWSSEPDYMNNNSDKIRPTTNNNISKDFTTKSNRSLAPEESDQRPVRSLNSDKIRTTNNNSSSTDFTRRSNRSLVLESDDVEQRSVRYRGVFTDEKAKKLRMLTSETESFHDAMYHSAIASRFASDFSGRSDNV